MTAHRLKMLVTAPIDRSDGSPLPFVGLEDIESGTGKLMSRELPTKAAHDSILFRESDVLFSKLRPYLAKSFIASAPGSGTGELLVLRSRGEIEPRFLFYSTLSSHWLEWAKITAYGTKMPRTSWEAMSEYRLDHPALVDQRRITDFLDAETARIDKLVNLRTLQVNKMKAGLTSEAARIDKSHQRLPLRRFVESAQTGTTPTEMLRPMDLGGLPWYTPAALGATLDLSNADKCVSSDDSSRIPRFQAESILIVGIGESLGKVAELNHTATGNQQLTAIKIGNNADHRFVLWQLFSAYEEIRAWAQYSRIRILNNEVLKSFRIPVPPLDQQIRRRQELDERLADFNEFRNSATHFVRLAIERRQALITAAVTGEITV